MKIVVAPDSFKGSLSAQEAAQAMETGIKRAVPKCRVVAIPMADGGEGTLHCLLAATGGRRMETEVTDPLGRRIRAAFGVLPDGVTCVVEMAEAAGLILIGEHERNPLKTTTYGVGELIRAGLDHGCRRFVIGLGGSATNDGGAGMLQALGVKFLDAAGKEVGRGGGELSRVCRVDTSTMDPRIRECEFLVACDVDNPFVGPHGASHVFGPQKGATPEMVAELDANLRQLADRIQEVLGLSIHDMPGAGAAGGLAGALVALCGGTLRSGVDLVAEVVKLEEEIRDADLVFTGEGRIDFQTVRGKTPFGVARIARRYGVPVIALAGSVGEGIEELYPHGMTAVVSMINRPMPLADAMAEAEEMLVQAAEQVMRIYLSREKSAEKREKPL